MADGACIPPSRAEPASPIRRVVIGDATLYCGDCTELIPQVGVFDALITDPPYGLSGSSGSINVARAKSVYATGTDTLDDVRSIYVPAIKLALSIAKRGAVTPGTPHSFEYPKPDDIAAIIQPCVHGMSKWGRPTWQPVLLYGKDPRAGLTIKALTVTVTSQPEKNGHPCPKPIETMMWMVDRASLVGETVLDPFMGSGTTGVAAIQLGRKFIGVERDPAYFEIACRRIEQAVAQGQLFVPTFANQIQEPLL